MTAVAHLALTRSKLAQVGDLDNVTVRAEGLEERNGFFCLVDGLDGITNNKGNFFNLLYAVTAGRDEEGSADAARAETEAKRR